MSPLDPAPAVRRPALIAAIALALLAILVLVLRPGSGAAQPRAVFAAPSAAQLLESPALLVDIRTPQEWIETGVLPNARLITFQSPEQLLRDIEPHLQPGQAVALICRTGNRTSRAAARLAPMIDAPVIDVGGGMVRLIREGYRPERPTRAAGCTLC